MSKMKKLLLFIIFIMTFFQIKNVYAFDSSNYRYRELCGVVELAEVSSNGSITTKGCYDTYVEARNNMNTLGIDNLVIFYNTGNGVKIIDSNTALLDLTVNDTLTYYYTNSELSGSSYTYMDNGSSYGGVDGVLLGAAYSSNKGTWVAKVKIANFTGWIPLSAYEIVPLAWVKSASYYTVTDTDIRHYYVSKIQNTYSGSSGRTIGPKPDMLPVGNYYSYDGHYFYKDLYTLVKDNRSNSHSNAVNKDKAYYNYYMYLSNHTRTAYSSINIDEYIRNNLGYTENVYGNTASSGTSRLYGEGTFFYYAQEKYGVNAVLSLSLSRNETGNGRSNLAINKNNGFGLNAVDSNPIQAANWYASFSSSVLGYASRWITNGYAHPRDWRYYGPQFGDKWIGMNVKYASDAYWSEKMAANYYSLDKAFGMQDYNYYQLGVVTDKTNAYQSPSTSSKLIYSYPEKEDAVVILEEVTSNNEKWYKVMSDINLDSNYNEITSGPYNWNSVVYVKASSVIKINEGKNGYISPNSVFEYENKNYEYDLCIENTELKPKVALTLKNAPYYYDSTLTSKTGKTVLKDRYVMVYAIALKDNIPVAYLITSDYWHDQKHWVSADSIKLITKTYGKVTIEAPGNKYTWVNYNTEDAEYSVIGGLYTNSYVPLLDTVKVGDATWYKVPVNLTGNDNQYGYTLAYYQGGDTTINVALLVSYSNNNDPIIIAKDQTLLVGNTFDPKQGVTASDAEDGDLTSKIVITENTVNTSKAGTYKVTYQVKDSVGNTTTKSITVTVKDNEAPTINAKDIKLYVGDSYNPKANVTASDKEDGDLTSKIVVETNTVNTSKEGTYKVIYKVTDSNNKTTTKEIKVTVITKQVITEDNLNLTNVEKKESIFYFDYLKEVDSKLQIKGYNTIRGINNDLNTEISYYLEFESLNSDTVYYQKIDRITNKNEITRPVNSTDSKDYTYSWFKGNIDFSKLPNDDYRIYIISTTGEYYARTIISNKVLKTQAATFHGDKYVTTRNNYYHNDLPLELIVRETSLGEKTGNSFYNMYNQYRTLEFKNNKLHMKGTSYSYGMNLGSSTNVERKIIFENLSTYQIYRFDLGSITEGLYQVGATLGDNLPKNRAWFDKEIDISSLPKGEYAIYLSNSSNIKDYGELNEILGRDVSKVTATINNKTYSFRLNQERRYRIELIIK